MGGPQVARMRELSRLTMVAVLSVAAVPAGAGERILYEHNGSTVAWFVDRGEIEATYAVPRPGLAEAGIRAGDILFKGGLENGRIIGRAFAFKAGCPPAGYEVSGEQVGDRIVLKGYGPHRAASSCTVVSYTVDSPHSRLVFTRR